MGMMAKKAGGGRGGKGGSNSSGSSSLGNRKASRGGRGGSSRGGRGGGKGRGSGKSSHSAAGAEQQNEQQQVADHSDSGESTAEDDIEFITENKDYAGFLMSLDSSKLEVHSKRSKREPRASDRDVESRPRPQASTSGWQADSSKASSTVQRLPIKNRAGVLEPNAHFIREDAVTQANKQQQELQDAADAAAADDTDVTMHDAVATAPGESDSADDMSADSDSDGDNSVYDSADDADDTQSLASNDEYSTEHSGTASTVTHDPIDLLKLREKRYHQKRGEIALLCESILENPEEAVMKTKAKPIVTDSSQQQQQQHVPAKKVPSKIEQLHMLAQDEDLLVQQLAMLSEYAVFKDIIPSFRIRVLTEKELSQRVSKEVQRVRDHERALLTAYQVCPC
jgi:nucleolar complex protein 3